MTACERFDELLQEELTDGLESAQRAEFEGHLASCPPCLRMLKGYLRATALAAAAYPDADEPTTPLPDATVRSVMEHVRRGSSSTGAASGVA